MPYVKPETLALRARRDDPKKLAARRLLSMPQGAASLGVSVRHLYRILRNDGLPVVKVGNRTMLSIAAVDAYIARQSGPFLSGKGA